MKLAAWELLPERMTKDEIEPLRHALLKALLDAAIPPGHQFKVESTWRDAPGEFDCVVCRVKTAAPDEDGLCADCAAQIEEELDAIMNMSDGEILAQWQAEHPGESVEEYSKSIKTLIDETLNKHLAATAMRQRGDTEPS